MYKRQGNASHTRAKRLARPAAAHRGAARRRSVDGQPSRRSSSRKAHQDAAQQDAEDAHLQDTHQARRHLQDAAADAHEDSGDRTPTKHSNDGHSPLEKAGIESSVEAFSLSPAPSLYVATDFSTMSLEDASNLSFTESGMLGTAASDSAKNKVLQQMDLQGVEVYDLRALNAEIHEELHPSPEKPSPSRPSPLKTPDSTTYSPSRFTTAAVGSPS